MSIKYYEDLGASIEDGLVIPSFPPADTFTVIARKLSEETTLKRGTLLDLSSGSGGDGNCVIHGTATADNETLTPFCILADDNVIGTDTNAMVGAYRRGHFAEEKLVIAEGATISDADKRELRGVGILISNAIKV